MIATDSSVCRMCQGSGGRGRPGSRNRARGESMNLEELFTGKAGNSETFGVCAPRPACHVYTFPGMGWAALAST